jgi:ubiquinone/menaquinone biosynthesis C-methylase UbiE
MVGQMSISARDEQSIALLYDDAKIAETYLSTRFTSSWGQLLHKSQVAAINHAIQLYQPPNIIEIAPGPARIATDLTSVHKGIMIDYSAEMLMLAKHRLCTSGLDAVWELRQHNAFDLAMLNLQCDLIYTFRFIRHFDSRNRSRLYREIYASLNPRGLFILDVVNRNVRQALDAKKPNLPADALAVYDTTYSQDEFHREMEAHGFTVLFMMPTIRYFQLQSWLSHTFDRRFKRFANLVVSSIEKLPWSEPLEWIALVCKAS